METFTYGTRTYEYELERSDRKTFSLVVKPNLHIIVRVPKSAQSSEIRSFLVKKWDWLERQLTELRLYQQQKTSKHYVAGESFQYLGRHYMLEVTKATEDKVVLAPGKITLHTTEATRKSEYSKLLISQWYRQRQRIIFRQQYKKALNIVKPKDAPKLEVKEMARRWGSYTSGNVININPRLIYADTSSIRYVLLHELVHTKHKTHSKEFYRELEKYIPDWKEIKQRLEVKYGQYQL